MLENKEELESWVDNVFSASQKKLKMKKKKYKVGLVVGRFQPFHLGHKYLIEKALEISDKIILGVGSSNIIDQFNPYDFDTRKKFLEMFVENEGLGDRVQSIVAIDDDPDDQVWLDKLISKTGKFDISIGDNEWVNGIFEKKEITVMRIGFYNREILAGEKIRNLINQKETWQDRVPGYLISEISKRTK